MMTDFTFSDLGPVGSTCFFPSTGSHLVINKLGWFCAKQTVRQNYPAGVPNDYAIDWISSTGLVTIPLPNLPTNQISIDGWVDGRVMLTYFDCINGGLVVMVWPDMSKSLVPIVNNISGLGTTLVGKHDLVCDERGCAFVGGDTGWIFRFSRAGTYLGRQQVFKASTVMPGLQVHYLSLRLDTRRKGELYLIMCSAYWNTTTMITPEYSFVSTLMCANPLNITGGSSPALWTMQPWASYSWLALPVDPTTFNNQSVAVLTGSEQLESNNLLLGANVLDGTLCVMIAQTAQFDERFFSDLGELSLQIITAKWDAGPTILTSAHSHNPVRSGLTKPTSGSGSPVFRGSCIYAICHDVDSIIVLRSQDGGASWHVFAKTVAPEIAGKMIHWISVCNGDPDDTTIEIVFAVIDATYEEWADGVCPVPPASAPNNPVAKYYRGSLPVPSS